MVAFHHGKQRIALGTTEGNIFVYDLRTATRTKVFEEHKGAIIAVEFNKAGTMLASYCREDHSVRTWKVESGGFLSGLLSKSSSKSAQLIELHPVSSIASSTKEFLELIELEWLKNDKFLSLKREDGKLYDLVL